MLPAGPDVELDPIEVHMAISALGFFSIASQYTFSTIFGFELGATGDVLSYLRARA